MNANQSASLDAPHGRRGRRQRVRLAAFGVALAGYAWLAGLAPSFAALSSVAVAVPGALITFAAFRPGAERTAAPTRADRLDPLGACAWAILLFAFFEWESAGYQAGSDATRPTLSVVLDPLLENNLIKSCAFLLWMLGGIALVRR